MRLTKLAPETARLQTLYHRHIRDIAFDVDGKRWRVEAGATAPGGQHGVTAYGRIGEDEFTVWLDEADWRTAAAAILKTDAATVDALPEELTRASLECLVSDVLDRLEAAVGLPVSLSRLEVGEQDSLSSAFPFRLFSPEGLRLGGAWIASGSEWRVAVGKALRGLPVPEIALPDDLPLAARVCVGMWRAPAAILDELQPGDVALSPAGQERFVRITGGPRFAAALEDGILRVEGTTMTDDASPAQPAEEGAAAGMEQVDNVEVELEARVGSLKMTLGDLRRLGAGQIVEFSTPVESPAILAVNGRAVATGELVDVGGRVGVRITSMSE